MTDYVRKLTELSAALSKQIHKVHEGELTGDPEQLRVKVGGWVRIKVHKRKWADPRWTGPYEVKEVTSHSVQVKGKSGAPWHHLTHCTPAPTPSRTLTEVRVDLSDLNLITTTEPLARGQPLGCYDFILAPGNSGVRYWLWRICVTNNPKPTSVTVRNDMTTPVKGSPSSPLFGPVEAISRFKSPDDVILTATGVSGFSNNWLLLTEEAANTTRQSCVVCMGARPLLRIVPAVVTLACLIPLMTTDNPRDNCTAWDEVYPVTKFTTRNPVFSNQVARANFTCVNMTGGGTEVGWIPADWCLDTVNIKGSLRPISRADVWWWCGSTVLFDKLPSNSTGRCALVTLLLPVSIYPIGAEDLVLRIQGVNPGYRGRSRRDTTPSSGDPSYIDAIGVPRGVPDEYKLIDQVAAGFESSICWWCTINKNVDRINYIHYNVQRLGNWTQQGFEAVHGQLAATSLMAFQNRIAIDMLLSEKGGVCSMFGDQCCTFIPNNTASDGSLTVALEGLRTLNSKMKSHSGIDTSMWDSWMSAFGKYKTLVSSILVSISVFAAILVLCGCCCIPCIRSLTTRVISRAIDPSSPSQMFPLLDKDLLEFEDEEESAY
uniref:Envelope polyprotein n=1 Tax=Oncorhynchus tshawytscha TaxID=74940 RepID=A0AAZ3P3C0_ONCTS